MKNVFFFVFLVTLLFYCTFAIGIEKDMNNTNEVQLSDLSWSIRGTLGRKLLKKSQQYEGVVDFTLGDPDIPTPDGICDAAINAIR